VYAPAVQRRARPVWFPAAWARAVLLCGGFGVCSSSACAPSPPRAGTFAGSYEGANFYEPAGADEAPTLSDIPSAAPGFYGLVSEDEPNPTCNGAASADVPRSIDPSLVCPRVTNAPISDFTFSAGGNPQDVNFAADAAFAGGTYFYPDAATALSSDVTGGDWHLSGMVDGVSGFGLYLNRCKELDVSGFGGIEFSLWGHIDPPGALVFFVGTAANQVSDAWIDEHKASPSDADEPPNVGRCIPIRDRYDGTCREARVNVPVTDTETLMRLTWRDLTDGCPLASVDAAEITSIAWYFPPGSAGAYSVDLHIDNLRFSVTAPP
jgi:hypothetical protein